MSVREHLTVLRSLNRRRKFLSMRLAGRKLTDLLHFGNGPVERIGAAFVLAAAFFVPIMIGTILFSVPAGTGAAFALCAFVGAAVTLMGFIIGPSDEKVHETKDELDSEIARERVELRQAEQEEAELREKEDEEASRHTRRRQQREEEDDRRPRRKRPSVARCQYCREDVDWDAVKCPYCGEWMDESYRPKPRRGVSPGVAALLSFLWAGLGQIGKGQVGAGLVWMLVVNCSWGVGVVCSLCTLGLSLLLPAALHLFCIVDAASGD